MAKTYAITKDLIDDGQNVDKVVPDEFTMKFGLYDDDHELYFEGLMKPTKSEAIFAPLDGIGASYGCTYMKAMINGRWLRV